MKNYSHAIRFAVAIGAFVYLVANGHYFSAGIILVIAVCVDE